MADLRGGFERLRAATPRASVFARRRALALAAVALVVVAAALGALLGGGGSKSGGPPPALGGGGPTGGPEAASFVARIVPPTAGRRRRGSGVPRSIANTVRRMSIQRKVAQLFLLGFEGKDQTAPIYRRLRALDLGGIVFDRANFTTTQQLSSQAGEAAAIARQQKHVPPWVMARQEGGEFNSLPGLGPASSPGELGSAGQARSEARAAAAALRGAGVNGLLGPVIDVGVSDTGDDAFGARVYSDDPAEVAAYASAAVSEYHRAKLFVAPEHFPGLGAANQPTEEGPAQVGQSLGQLRTRDLVPFRAAFRAGADGVTLSSGAYAADDGVTPGSVSKKVATDVLRRSEGFRGVAITDDLADPAVSVNYSAPAAAVAALRAGADAIYISGSARDQQAAYDGVLRAAQRKKISRARIDEALLRILTAKRSIGLIR